MGYRPAGGATGVLLAVALILIFGFSVSWIWTTLALVLRSAQAVSILSFAVQFPLTFASNVFVNPATMPGWLRARAAGLDYIAFKALDGGERFLTDDQLEQAKRACQQAGLTFAIWQYVYAIKPPSEEAQSFASLIRRFDPAFVFVDVEKEYEAKTPASGQYAAAFRAALPHFPATIAPFGRADLHPGIDYQAWHNHGFGVAPQAYECGIGHHAAAPQSVDHTDLRPGFSAGNPSVFPDK